MPPARYTQPRAASVTERAELDRRLDSERAEQAIERVVALAFAPLHKRVFGMAIGIGAAVFVAVMTVAALVVDPEHGLGIGILSVYFRGYDVSARGVVVGAVWAGFVGFIAGWFVAFCRNLVMATWLLYVRARASLQQSRDLLDHI